MLIYRPRNNLFSAESSENGSKFFWHFSFASYSDSNNNQFGCIKHLNEDIWLPGEGMTMHPHTNEEIFSIILNGLCEHKDSLGNVTRLSTNHVQNLSAGKGIKHSEMNLGTDNFHLLQIWLNPCVLNGKPKYEMIEKRLKQNFLNLLATYDDEEIQNNDAILLNSNAKIYRGYYIERTNVLIEPKIKDCGYYIYNFKGDILVNGTLLKTYDAAKITDEKNILIKTNPILSDFLIIETLL